MATQAEQIVATGGLPVDWKGGADEVRTHMADFYRDLQHVNSVLADEDEPQPGRDYASDHELIMHRVDNFGVHAYRYEVCDDGSVVALYVNDESNELKLKAFKNLAKASNWTPRDEREVGVEE